MPNNTKPFVGAALICEKVLKEEGNIYSAVRIVDTWTLTSGPIDQIDPNAGPVAAYGPSALINIHAFIMVKAGAVSGQHEMALMVRGPDGSSARNPQTIRVEFSGNDPAEGATLTIVFFMPTNSKPGLYWIDVLWDEETLTSMPLKLVVQSPLPGSVSH